MITMAPTPESEAFLAKKPKVPPTFDGVDYDDTPRFKQAQDAIIREQWVKSMMARLVREELGKCYYREGVNHLEKCGALRGKLGTLLASRCYTSQFREMASLRELILLTNTDVCNNRKIFRALKRSQDSRIPVRTTKLRSEGIEVGSSEIKN